MSRHANIPTEFSEDQAFCACVLAELMRGFHHVPTMHVFGRGIATSINSSRFSTYDFDLLTRLVLLAHRYAVRVELGNGGPRAVKLILHRRKHCNGEPGTGMQQWERHPDLDGLIALAETTKKKGDIEAHEIAP